MNRVFGGANFTGARGTSVREELLHGTTARKATWTLLPVRTPPTSVVYVPDFDFAFFDLVVKLFGLKRFTCRGLPEDHALSIRGHGRAADDGLAITS